MDFSKARSGYSGDGDSNGGSEPDISAYGFTGNTPPEMVDHARLIETRFQGPGAHNTPEPISYDVAFLFSKIDKAIRLIDHLNTADPDDSNRRDVREGSLRELKDMLVSMTENSPLSQEQFDELCKLLHERFGMVFGPQGEFVDSLDIARCPPKLLAVVQGCRAAIADTLQSLERLPAG